MASLYTPGVAHYAAPPHAATPSTAAFLGSERSAAADAQLQREARVESLSRRWAEVATSFNDWLQDTLLLLSERWPVLEGNARMDVREQRSAHTTRERSAHTTRERTCRVLFRAHTLACSRVCRSRP